MWLSVARSEPIFNLKVSFSSSKPVLQIDCLIVGIGLVATGGRLRAEFITRDRTGNSLSFGVLALICIAFVVFPILGLAYYFLIHHSAPILWSSLFSAVVNSVVPSLVAITIGMIIAIPTGFFISRATSKGAAFLGFVLRLPLGVPPLVAGIMLLIVFGPNSPIGKVFHGRLTNTLIAITIAQLFASVPYVIEGSRGAFALLDEEVMVVADSLKMKLNRRLLSIYLPMVWSAIRSSLVLGYLRGFGEFGAVLLVAYNPTSLPIYTYVSFEGAGLPSTVTPVLVTLVISGTVAYLISRIAWPTRVIEGGFSYFRSQAKKRYQSNSKVERGDFVDGASFISVEGTVGGFELDINFTIEPGCSVILGPSGSGKTLTLHSLANHRINGVKLSIDGPLCGALHSSIGYVPQRLGLWPHMTVEQNLRLCIDVSGSDLEISEVLEGLDILELRGRMPKELSGGQYQRAAIARAMCSGGKLLILDEPLSALDLALRRSFLSLLAEHVKSKVPYLIMVTHDVDEALYLADSIVVMSHGEVLQQGTPSKIIDSPYNRAVAGIAGFDNIIIDRDQQGNGSLGDRAYFYSSDAVLAPIDVLVEVGLKVLGDYQVVETRPSTRGRLVTLSNGENTISGWIPPERITAYQNGEIVGVGIRKERYFRFPPE